MPTQRRTQAERRAETIARLVDGTISALSELGYARTTAREICARAGVSPGALFGRFATLTDLVLAAAEEVARRQIDRFERQMALIPDDQPAAVLPLIRASTRDPINAVWIELHVAARTDAALRERFRPVFNDFAMAMLAASKQVPLLEKLPEPIRPLVVAHVVHYFNGESLSGVLYPSVEFDAQRMELLTTMIRLYVDQEFSASS